MRAGAKTWKAPLVAMIALAASSPNVSPTKSPKKRVNKTKGGGYAVSTVQKFEAKMLCRSFEVKMDQEVIFICLYGMKIV